MSSMSSHTVQWTEIMWETQYIWTAILALTSQVLIISSRLLFTLISGGWVGVTCNEGAAAVKGAPCEPQELYTYVFCRSMQECLSC
jgi:hypothetical protein